MEAYFNVISFVVGIVSIVLSIVSIWLAMDAAKQAKSLNDDTRNLLSEIKILTESTQQIIIGEADKNSQHIRQMNDAVLAKLLNTKNKALAK